MRRISIALGVMVATALVGQSVVPAQAMASTDGSAPLSLAEPTGPYRVGRTTLHLKDPGRADPWVPAKRRELMVSVWYPTWLPRGRTAAYTSRKESELLVRHFNAGLPPGAGLPLDLLATVETHAKADAPPLPGRGALALVVLSPGWELPRSSQSGLAEDLASRGYVVAAIDHTYESVAVEFPDGRVTGCVACARLAALPEDQHERFFEKVTAGRAADVSFVLDRLTGSRPAWRGGRSIDPRRIAMAGHSIGGASALPAMLADARVKAGINMDGRQSPALTVPFDRPFMLLGGEQSVPGGDIGWGPTWDRLTGWKRWLSVRGMGHESFSDLAVLLGQLGAPLPGLPGDRCVRIVTGYVAGFLDLHLRKIPQPLLDGPSARFPEVDFHS
ncbi:alpha/beta hydrolase [Nonomuraea sp. NPDC050310]|uniref:alpha/beta hydrolase family protein n=1 Tax=Nonomuraea sp. NPDC050310 TaxID=3154935 RepID=UPI0033F57EE1